MDLPIVTQRLHQHQLQTLYEKYETTSLFPLPLLILITEVNTSKTFMLNLKVGISLITLLILTVLNKMGEWNGFIRPLSMSILTPPLAGYDLLDELTMIRDKCMEFNTKYNQRRFHQSLGYKTPQEYVILQVEKQTNELYRMHRS